MTILKADHKTNQPTKAGWPYSKCDYNEVSGQALRIDSHLSQRGAAIKLASIAGLFAAAAYAMNHPWIQAELFDIDHLRTHFQNHDMRSGLTFMIAAAALNALGVPRLWISTIAGTFFGAVAGSVMALVATLGGSSLNFFGARYLFTTPVMRFLPRRVITWMSAFSRNGFRFTLCLRLFPFANATVTNLVCGVSAIRYKTFILASALGFLPLTIVFATLGSSAAKASHWQMIIGLTLFIILMAVQHFFKQFAPGGQNSLQEADSANTADMLSADPLKG